tara:strand:- start:1499 stop:2632 length:1134 start_codon:yes stop_codon:yes gene_type:complete
MGFLSKLWKGVKKVVKKIGKGIKKVAMKVGKFMNKIGIVGQIAMSFLLPGLGEILGGWAATMMGSSSAIVSGAGKFLNAAVNIGQKASSIVSSVTEGVTKVVGEVVGAVANKIPGMDKLVSGMSGGKINITDKNWGTVKAAAESAFTKTGDAVTSLFSKDTLTGLNKYATKAQIATNMQQNPVELDLINEDGTMNTKYNLAKDADGNIIPKGIELSDTLPKSLLEPLPTPSFDSVTGKLDVDYNTTLGATSKNFGIDPDKLSPTVSKQLGVDDLYAYSDSLDGSTFVPAKTESKLSASNIGKAIKKTFGANGEPLGDGSYVQSIDVPDLDQNRGGVLADLTERRIRPLQVQGLYASPNTVITSNWSKNMAQNLSFTG